MRSLTQASTYSLAQSSSHSNSTAAASPPRHHQTRLNLTFALNSAAAAFITINSSWATPSDSASTAFRAASLAA